MKIDETSQVCATKRHPDSASCPIQFSATCVPPGLAQGGPGVPVVPVVPGVPVEKMATGLHRLAAQLNKRPSRRELHDHKVSVSLADAVLFPSSPCIQELVMDDLRRFAGKKREEKPLPGLHRPPPECPNMGYLVGGLVPFVADEHPDSAMRRRMLGDLGLQVLFADFPLVQLPAPETQAGLVKTRASQCVVGLVRLLRQSVPKFWETEWDIFSAQDFSQDRHLLTTDAVYFLTGVLKFAELVMHGSYPHDTYLAWVGAPA